MAFPQVLHYYSHFFVMVVIVKFPLVYFLLMLIPVIWGSGFVAQRLGMESLEPFSFNAARFALATLILLPVWWFVWQRQEKPATPEDNHLRNPIFWWGSALAGTVMSIGFGFQQVGLLYTTAGNAGFITSMYIVIVPLLGLLMGQVTRLYTWIGIVLAVIGLYQLSIDDRFQMNEGDALELMGAFFWALHVVSLGWLSRKFNDGVGISVVQFAVATLWAAIVMWMVETPRWPDFQAAIGSLLYAGIVVSGLAFTLQIIVQRTVSASIAALVFSLEAVFALFFGWLLLAETVTLKALFGCGLMLAGIMISQWPEKTKG